MTPVFKPGDRVRVTWGGQARNGKIGVVQWVTPYGNMLAMDDDLVPFPDECLEPAPAPSPDTPEPVPDVAEDQHHCGCPVGGDHLVSCPTILGDIVRSRTAGKSPVVDVTEDREGLRESVARALHEGHKPFCDYTYAFEDPMSSAHVYRALAGAVLPIIDRHTAKAINHAVMAQDSALEVALRERDEARAEVQRVRETSNRHKTDMYKANRWHEQAERRTNKAEARVAELEAKLDALPKL